MPQTLGFGWTLLSDLDADVLVSRAQSAPRGGDETRHCGPESPRPERCCLLSAACKRFPPVMSLSVLHAGNARRTPFLVAEQKRDYVFLNVCFINTLPLFVFFCFWMPIISSYIYRAPNAYAARLTSRCWIGILIGLDWDLITFSMDVHTVKGSLRGAAPASDFALLATQRWKENDPPHQSPGTPE